MARKRTGQLIKRGSGYYARVSTIVDGERVRVMRALGTQSLPAARRKLERLLAADEPAKADPSAGETFAEAAERVYRARLADAGGRRGPHHELAQLRIHAFEMLGPMPVNTIKPTDINAVLDAVKARGLAMATAQHVKQRVSNVFAALQREGTITANPVEGAVMPKWPTTVVRERAVLTDAELAVYLAWEPAPMPNQGDLWLAQRRAAVRELQTMVCLSRMFGGLRAGDLNTLRWDAFDVEHGAFTWGYAPRQKTRRPQLLDVPEMLRPILRDHWERAGRPHTGLVFPVRRVGRFGDRIGQDRRGGSFAKRFRRDLERAFKAAAERNVEAPRERSQRWRELFSHDEPYTLPVDFHSWRRSYVQALADADVNAQQAQALAGHASLAAHARYLRSAGKMRQLPDAALPDLRVMPALPADQRALAKGSAGVSGGVLASDPPPADRKTQTNQQRYAFPETYKANVAGSIPVPPTEIVEESAAGVEAKGTNAAFSTAETADPVEQALGEALRLAALHAAEGKAPWSAVELLTAELRARREARAGVVHLDGERKRRGRS